MGAVPHFDTLDQICKGKREVFVFFDFNNNIKGLYYEEMMKTVVSAIQSNPKVFPSWLIDEWMMVEEYAKSRKVKMHMTYFSEGGESYYHTSIFKNYKKSRKNASFMMSSFVAGEFESYDNPNELIRAFLVSSWKLIELYCSDSNIFALRMENLDADFVPEMLIHNFNIYQDDDDVAYIIISSDGDYIQTLDYADNIYIVDCNHIITYYNWPSSKSYLVPRRKKEAISESTSFFPENTSPDRIILFKAIVGDSSDSIPGIKGVGPVAFYDSFLNLIPDDVRADDIDAIEKICLERKADNKVCAKILENFDTFSRMIRLVSFRHLIKWLQGTQNYLFIKGIIKRNRSAFEESANLMGAHPRKKERFIPFGKVDVEYKKYM